MRNRTLMMLLGGAMLLAGSVADRAGAAPDPPEKRPRLAPPPIDVWWAHTNQDRMIPINDPGHTNQDGADPPKDPPLPLPSGAQGDDRGDRSRRFDPSMFEDLGGGGSGGLVLPPPPPGTVLLLGGRDGAAAPVIASIADAPGSLAVETPLGTSTIPGAGALPLLALAGLAGAGRRRRR